MKLKSRGQGNDLSVPISAFAKANLDTDDVDPIDAVGILGGHTNSPDLGTRL